MSAQILTIAGVALLVLILASRAGAGSEAARVNDPANWNYIKGYTPGSGYYA